ncbi:hypothetical protein AVEN_137773-1 [Araneus ventricosus]|uniref:Uncharacterized protein n=1 Tax=Araneus ventricosus TaxID=182803 RepID=A0A4Y2WGP8_ARAVE|nr:hypothetical protein AVEN_136291-1 [Araneus ventricosus]GBO35756.1 hypothetical protein AVEN_137773-1 [Araneus ventricosus]
MYANRRKYKARMQPGLTKGQRLFPVHDLLQIGNPLKKDRIYNRITIWDISEVEQSTNQVLRSNMEAKELRSLKIVVLQLKARYKKIELLERVVCILIGDEITFSFVLLFFDSILIIQLILSPFVRLYH